MAHIVFFKERLADAFFSEPESKPERDKKGRLMPLAGEGFAGLEGLVDVRFGG